MYQKNLLYLFWWNLVLNVFNIFYSHKNHDFQQQITAHPSSSYVKKLKDGAVNQLVNDLIIAKGMVWYGFDGVMREGVIW